MERKFKTLIKEAILEALVEFTNGSVATLRDDEIETNTGSKPTTGAGNGTGNNGQGGGSEDSSGGGLNNGRPIPDVGVGTWSLRK